MIYSVDVRVSAPVRDTELEDRVVRAITNLFPGAEIERTESGVVATAHDLDHLAERLREQRILDTARSVFLDARRGDRFSFALKKPAALHDVVNFSVGEPSEIGEISVEVRVRDPDAETYIEHVAPPTDEEGRPVD